MKNFNVISLMLMVATLSSHTIYTEESDRVEQPDSTNSTTHTSLNRQVIPCLIGTISIAIPSIIIGTLCYYLDCDGSEIAKWAGAVAIGMEFRNHLWSLYSENQKQYWAKVGSRATAGTICVGALGYILITAINKTSSSI